MNRELHPRRFSFLIAGLAALSIAFLIHAQSIPQDEIRFGTRPYFPQPENAIRVRTDLVEVPVVVRDSNDAVVKGLTKDDFEIFDQGKKRDISFFAVESAPRINA